MSRNAGAVARTKKNPERHGPYSSSATGRRQKLSMLVKEADADMGRMMTKNYRRIRDLTVEIGFEMVAFCMCWTYIAASSTSPARGGYRTTSPKFHDRVRRTEGTLERPYECSLCIHPPHTFLQQFSPVRLQLLQIFEHLPLPLLSEPMRLDTLLFF